MCSCFRLFPRSVNVASAVTTLPSGGCFRRLRGVDQSFVLSIIIKKVVIIDF